MPANKYRQSAGSAGDVTRLHPASISAEPLDTTNPPTFTGQGVVVDATSNRIRKLISGDGTSTIVLHGVTVRSYPFQQSATGTSSYDSKNFAGGVGFGGGALPVGGVVDVIQQGFVLVNVPTGQAPVKGGNVYIWNAASNGVHVNGGFEASSTGGSTVQVTNAVFTGGVDSNGNAEIKFNIPG